MTHSHERLHMKKLLLSAVLFALAIPAVATAAPAHSLTVSTGRANIQRLAQKNRAGYTAVAGACHHSRGQGLFATVNWRQVKCSVVVLVPVPDGHYRADRYVGTSTLGANGTITTSIRPA